MNERSFIYKYKIMARIADENKLERLKLATMKLVAENGYGGASAALIAANSDVSTGYFYRLYKGKYELVNSLLLDVYKEVAGKLDELIQEGSSFQILIASLISYFFKMANKEPVKAKFFYVLTSDYRFKSDHEVKSSIFEYINKIMDIGRSSNELDEKLSQDDIYLMLLINTIQFINQRFKNSQSKVKFTKADEGHLLYLINKVLK